MAEHRLSATPTHSRWNNAIPARLEIASGDTVHMECVDASGGQVQPGMTAAEFSAIDRERIHALTGPIAIEGAAPGDVLEVSVLEVRHLGWGWTSIIPGLGLLDDCFRDPFLFHWQLDGDRSRSLPPATVPLAPFCGVMGVARATPGEFRTRPPGPFGGNMDVRELSAGSTLYLPVECAGALFSAGDAHAAQGDGEVCINAIECPAEATLRFRLHKHQPLSGPVVEAGPRAGDPDGAWLVVESAEDALEAARGAVSRMVDFLVARWQLSPAEAYVLTSVTVDLKLSQVVNRPMITVSAALPKSVLPARTLF